MKNLQFELSSKSGKFISSNKDLFDKRLHDVKAKLKVGRKNIKILNINMFTLINIVHQIDQQISN